MKKRQILILATALFILIGGKLIADLLATSQEKKPAIQKKGIATVFTEEVNNDTVRIYLESTGTLKAVKRMELYSEVQGVMEADNGRFKSGNAFKKGDILLSIRSNDQRAQLYAQRSDFKSLITSIMPDLKTDYSEAAALWQEYLQNLSVDESVPELPKVQSEKLSAFLSGRGLYSSYHSLRNTEILNSKYQLIAPYDGTLIETNVDPGTVIRPGQALGVFIQPHKYELETSIDAISAARLAIGQKVELSRQGVPEKTWEGKISRLVNAIDPNSQLSDFFVAIESKELREGMFLQARVKAREVVNAIEISRSALIDNQQVYIVVDSVLTLKQVVNEHNSDQTAVVSGLLDGEKVLTKIPPSAFPGMKVSIYKGSDN